MSKIEDLIAELCPNGVPYFELKDIFNLRNGYTPSKSNPSYWSDGTIPWFRMEDIRENGSILDKSIQYVNESAVKGGRLFPANSILIATSATIGEHALITVPHLSNQRFTSLSLNDEYADKLDIKFVYYYCFILDDWCRRNTTKSSFASVEMNGFKRFPIPVPPLDVQKEIVMILNSFAGLETELQLELEARNRQYGYYRNQLMSFKKTSDVQWTNLGEVGEVTKLAGFEFTKYVKYSLEGTIIALRGLNIKGSLDLTEVKYIDGSDFSKLNRSKLITGDMMFTYVGTVGQVALIDEDDKYYLAPNVARIRFDRDKILPKFMKYYFQSDLINQQINKFMMSSSMKNLTMESIRKFMVPIPPIAEQHRIVSVLDKFDSLVHDDNNGLPAEIKLRNKQQEYYLSKLLTFQELSV